MQMKYFTNTFAKKAPSPNRAYLALLRFAQILLRKTSDTLGTLGESANCMRKHEKRMHFY